MRVATYARVSTDEQAQHGTSLESQQERTLAYVEERGWTHVSHYADEGVSGAKESRPALNRLIRAAGNGEIDAVVVTVLDRFTRDERLWHNWKHLLTGLGVSIVTCDGTVDTADDESWFTDSVLAAVAAKYRRDFAKRTSQGRRKRAKEGVWVGGRAPFGFRIEGRNLAHQEDEAETLRRATTLVLSNVGTLHEVAAMLNTEERYPRQGNPRWYPRDRKVRWDSEKLRYALTRETLIGVHVYGKGTSEEIKRDCPEIISRDEWDKLQTTLAATKRGVYRGKKLYPLSGRLISQCGLNYSGLYDSRTDRRYYRCKGREEKPYCSCSRIDARTIEDQVWWQIVPLLEDPERLLALTGLDVEESEAMQRQQLKKLDAKVANLSTAITQRAAAALSSGVDPTLIAAAVEELERERSALVERRAKLAEWEDLRKEREGRRARVRALTRASLKLLTPTLEFQKTLLSLLDVSVLVAEEGLEIQGLFREDLPELLYVVDPTMVEGRR